MSFVGSLLPKKSGKVYSPYLNAYMSLGLARFTVFSRGLYGSGFSGYVRLLGGPGNLVSGL